jgi:hypothetical protein
MNIPKRASWNHFKSGEREGARHLRERLMNDDHTSNDQISHGGFGASHAFDAKKAHVLCLWEAPLAPKERGIPFLWGISAARFLAQRIIHCKPGCAAAHCVT